MLLTSDILALYSERVSLSCLKLLFTKAQVARRSTGLVAVIKEKVSQAG